MKRIAIFAEGQAELIFIRCLLFNTLDPSKMSFECYELLAHSQSAVPYHYRNPSADIHFLILNVHGDEGVLSSIKERERNLIERRGYETIIGLRDMYSDYYIKRSPNVINEAVSSQIIENNNATVENMTYSDRIKLHFAIMEVEAWFLGMYNLFRKIDSLLTLEYIKQHLKIDLKIADPQKDFYRPSNQVHEIFQLCGREYKKKQGEVESICSKMDSTDFDNARENSRCACFNAFYEDMISCC